LGKGIFLIRFEGEQPGAMEELLRRLSESGVIDVSEPDYLIHAG
jgi:hypothetical protein